MKKTEPFFVDKDPAVNVNSDEEPTKYFDDGDTCRQVVDDGGDVVTFELSWKEAIQHHPDIKKYFLEKLQPGERL